MQEHVCFFLTGLCLYGISLLMFNVLDPTLRIYCRDHIQEIISDGVLFLIQLLQDLCDDLRLFPPP